MSSVIEQCDKAIRNGNNIKEMYTKIKALVDVNGGSIEYDFIKGNLQNSPVLNVRVRFADLNEYTNELALLEITTVERGTKIKFSYYPNDYSWDNRRTYKLDDLHDEFESVTKKKGITFEQFKPIYLKLNRDMDSSEYSKEMNQILAELKLAKDFK